MIGRKRIYLVLNITTTKKKREKFQITTTTFEQKKCFFSMNRSKFKSKLRNKKINRLVRKKEKVHISRQINKSFDRIGSL